MAAKYHCFRRKLPILKRVISSKSVRAIEHRAVEDTSTATIIQDRIVWHDTMLHHEQYTGESSAMFLPMINLNPSDPSCICTIMQFVSYRDKQYDATLSLTFDQPLYRKAGGSDLKRMFVTLRRFHMQTSFLCSIGHLMADSGLQYILEVVFADNDIRHNYVDWQNYLRSSLWPHVDRS